MPPKVSVIIVNYHSRTYLNRLVASLKAGRFQDFEVIVVDNDHQNVGYSRGVNAGAARANGQYLFVVNPDALAFTDTLNSLVHFLDSRPDVGLVAPQLIDSSGHPYPLQGTGPLTPLSALFALSFINKLWPGNPVSRAYWLHSVDRSRPHPVAVAPGTAFLIRRTAFNQVHGFDPRFFLYFEESDLCRRLISAGWKIYLEPASRLVHYWAKSTPATPLIAREFSASRSYYFTKHYGRCWAYLVQLVCTASLFHLIAAAVTLAAVTLRWHQLTIPEVPIPDQVWFINSAKSAFLTGRLPFLGITASITWLHQGPLWTYFLIPAPYSGRLLIFVSSLLCLPLLYVLVRHLKNRRSALLALTIYALLPYFVRQSSFAYHTSLLPLFTLVTGLALIKGRSFLAGLFTGFLYQLHLLTFLFWPIPLYAYLTSRLLGRRFLTGLALGLLPFIISGPISTLGIFGWLVKQAVTSFSGVSGVSDAYVAVLALPALIALSLVL